MVGNGNYIVDDTNPYRWDGNHIVGMAIISLGWLSYRWDGNYIIDDGNHIVVDDDHIVEDGSFNIQEEGVGYFTSFVFMLSCGCR